MIRVGANRVCASSNSGEDFFEGPRNDVVQVFVDDTLVHTGTSWEDFFRYCEATDTSRTVDSLLLQARTSGGTAPGTSGYGFLVDNLDLESGPAPTRPRRRAGVNPRSRAARNSSSGTERSSGGGSAARTSPPPTSGTRPR